MLNVGGGELLVIALVALIALGPEQLPAVMRKLGALSAQLRSITTDLKDEFLSGVDETSGDRSSNRTSGGGTSGGGTSGGGSSSSRRPVARFDPNEPIVPRGYAERRAMENGSTPTSDDEPADSHAPQDRHQSTAAADAGSEPRTDPDPAS